VLNERHAQRLLGQFRDWYNQDRVHLALGKDAPDHRPKEPPELAKVVALPRLGGLHHRYCRRADERYCGIAGRRSVGPWSKRPSTENAAAANAA
jgi:hypothetical protein